MQRQCFFLPWYKIGSVKVPNSVEQAAMTVKEDGDVEKVTCTEHEEYLNSNYAGRVQ